MKKVISKLKQVKRVINKPDNTTSDKAPTDITMKNMVTIKKGDVIQELILSAPYTTNTSPVCKTYGTASVKLLINQTKKTFSIKSGCHDGAFRFENKGAVAAPLMEALGILIVGGIRVGLNELRK